MKSELYPLKFTPILKDKIWGGQKLKEVLNRQSNLPNIGESWEISDVEGDTSIVANGPLENQSLRHLLSTYKSDLIGKKNYQRFSNKFPLLIKFIDAKEDLSIQLHPNDKLAKSRHNSFGKTEMWYVMQADQGAQLIVGLKDGVTLENYQEHLQTNSLTKILNFDEVKEGDTYFIESGRVHAIGAGVLLAEIQQTSDITYRIYDWDRTDDNGNHRELHTELALDALDFNMKDDFRVSYNREANEVNKMVSCDFFTTNYLELNEPTNKHNNKDSFIIYMCVGGSATFKYNNFTETLEYGQTILISAIIEEYTIVPHHAKLLEVYLD
ncbi:mannose-6-phosphate isomerase, type 1 [Flavobacteriaceae bacterium MAR_2010_188]|nr:mannose-6-phosphate isomerase, type 1 [Flavobacteriaceae bacterium MAR_2010_188]